jgi:hypothetical protein
MPMDLRRLLLDGPTLEIKDPPDRAAEDAFPGVKMDANRTLEKRRKSNMFDLLSALVSLMVGWLSVMKHHFSWIMFAVRVEKKILFYARLL